MVRVASRSLVQITVLWSITSSSMVLRRCLERCSGQTNEYWDSVSGGYGAKDVLMMEQDMYFFLLKSVFS